MCLLEFKMDETKSPKELTSRHNEQFHSPHRAAEVQDKTLLASAESHSQNTGVKSKLKFEFELVEISRQQLDHIFDI